MFDADNNEDYYKPILVKSSFNESYKYYESGGDKDEKTIDRTISWHDQAIFKWFNKWK